jgi:AraC-like DNA-binding protein
MVFAKEVLHLIFVKKGVLFILLEKKEIILTSSYVFCFNGNENVTVVNGYNVEILRLSFCPNAINSSFTIENIKNIPDFFSKTDLLDCYCLTPFIKRTDSFFGQIETGFEYADKINHLIINIMNLSNNNCILNKDFLYRSCLLELLLIIKSKYSDIDIINNSISRIDKPTILEDVIAYFHLYYGEKIKISNVTKKFNTNRTTLSKLFKNILGLSPVEYLNRIRISKANYLLRESSMTVNQIMIETGFNNRNYFNKVFKKHMGCKPSEYRRRFD